MNKIIKVGIVIAVVGFTIFIIGIIANAIDPDRVYSTKPYGRGVVHYENEFAHWMKGIGGLGFFIGGFVVMWGDKKEENVKEKRKDEKRIEALKEEEKKREEERQKQLEILKDEEKKVWLRCLIYITVGVLIISLVFFLGCNGILML